MLLVEDPHCTQALTFLLRNFLDRRGLTMSLRILWVTIHLLAIRLPGLTRIADCRDGAKLASPARLSICGSSARS